MYNRFWTPLGKLPNQTFVWLTQIDSFKTYKNIRKRFLK